MMGRRWVTSPQIRNPVLSDPVPNRLKEELPYDSQPDLTK
jgi:hypothetical protein